MKGLLISALNISILSLSFCKVAFVYKMQFLKVGILHFAIYPLQ